jgi:hypothetical protein
VGVHNKGVQNQKEPVLAIEIYGLGDGVTMSTSTQPPMPTVALPNYENPAYVHNVDRHIVEKTFFATFDL